MRFRGEILVFIFIKNFISNYNSPEFNRENLFKPLKALFTNNLKIIKNHQNPKKHHFSPKTVPRQKA